MTLEPTEAEQLERERNALGRRLAEVEAQLRDCRSQVESMQRFRAAFENSPVAKSLTGIDGNLQVNRAFCDMLGYSEHELARLSWRELTHPDDVAESENVMNAFAAGATTRAHWEKRYLHKSGWVVWGEVVTAVQTDSRGKPAFLITSVLDVTERKRMELELHQVTLVLQSIRNVDQLIAREKDAGVLIRRSCEILTETRGFSSAWIALLDESGNYRMGASAGLCDAFSTLADRIRGGGLGPCARALRTRGVCLIDDPSVRCPGCPASPSCAGQSVLATRLENGGVVLGMVVVAMDTELARRQHEQELVAELADDIAAALRRIDIEREWLRAVAELTDSEDRYRSLFSHMNEGFFEAAIISDAAGRALDFRFIDVNPAHGRILGLPREQVVGRTTSQLFPGLGPEWLERVGQVAGTGAPSQVEGFVQATGRWYAHSYFSPGPGRFASVFSDITERKRAEAEIESLARFPSENPNPVLRVDRDGLILYANASSDELLVHWSTARGSRLPEALTSVVGEVARVARHRNLDVEVASRVYAFDLEPVPSAGYVNLYGRDVTERMRAEQIVRASESRYRSLFDSMLNGLAYCRVIFDGDQAQDFVYLEVNSAFSDLTGLRDVIGKRVTEVIPGIRDSDPRLFEVYGRVSRTGVPERFETYVHGLDMWFVISVFSPQPEHFVAVFDVITERKRMELEQRATVELLSLINQSRGTIELVRSAVGFFQRESDCEAVGIRLREGDDFPYCETHGFPPEFVQLESSLCERDADGRLRWDAAGNPLIACMCGNVISGRFDPAKPFFSKHGSFWTNCTTELLATTTEADRQARTRNRCNGEGYESVALIPLRVRQQNLGLIQLNDRRKGRFTAETIVLWERLAGYLAVGVANARAEDELRRHRDDLERAVADRTAKLEAVNRDMEAFSYSVSHDLRAPLRAIDGFTRILIDEQGAKLDDEGRRVCGIIRQNTERMGHLIDDLLSLSRLGRSQLEPRAVDMGALVQEVFEQLTAPEARSRIDWQLDGLPSAVVNPSLMRQVWLNLLGNALKFSSKRARASIRVRGERRQSENVYSVEDNGAGFDMSYANKLFRVFERLHSSRDFEGTGVGLALVQLVLRRHGGRVWAEGQPDRGATFSFALPAAEE